MTPHELSPLMSALLGMLTGIGGGIVRDVFLAEIPVVLKSDFYAVAALVGAAFVSGGYMLKLPVSATALSGGLVCFLLRTIAIQWDLRLPVANKRKSRGRPK